MYPIVPKEEEMNTQRIKELEAKQRQINEELKMLRDKHRLKITNAEKLIYPVAYSGVVETRYVSPSAIGDVIRKVLTPRRNDKTYIAFKKLVDLTDEEHRAVCSCLEECVEVIDRYNKQLHPYGINLGAKYTSDDDFFVKEEDYENSKPVHI